MHRRVLCTPQPLRPMVSLIGGIDEVVDTEPLAAIDSKFEHPCVAVNLHGRGPQSTKTLQDLRPTRLIAFGCHATPGPQWRAEEHERVRWCRLLEESGIAADPDDLQLARSGLPVPPRSVRGATVIHPGASSGARMWPADRFAAVARRELARGRRVVVTGTRSERSVAHAVVEHAGLPPSANRAGTTTLPELAAIVAHAGAVCSGDTGIAHLATAFGTPSVVLFGPVSPRQWGPPSDTARHRALWKGIPGDAHAERPAAGLLLISVDEVAHALREVRSVA
jgi:ADP-heptose:LPS heptosyltransferase